MRTSRPVVGVISDRRMLGPHPFQVQGEKYLTALVHGAGAWPVGLPVLGPELGAELALREILDVLDGVLLTGSPSNVAPHRYQGPASREGTLHDPERDHSAFELIPAVVEAGMPLFAICRGFQELNVAFGGTLHQDLESVPGLIRHREDRNASLEEQYGPAHDVRFTPGGMLARLTGQTGARVNTVHGQGVERLAPRLQAEATAPDGLIEAATVQDAPGFALGVQWHPEWRAGDNPLSMAMFGAFGDACRSYRS